MNLLTLIIAQFRQHSLRTFLTIMAIAAGFLLYGYLCAIKSAFTQGVDFGKEDRLLVRHKISLAQLLPVAYKDKIRHIAGVSEVLSEVWFGGVYQDPKNFFGQIAVEPETFMKIYPEYIISSEASNRWLRMKIGAIVGQKTADRFGWKVGDRIVLISSIWPKSDGSRAWEFEIVGIYRSATPGTDPTLMFFRYDYLDEMRLYGKGWVGWFVVKVDSPMIANKVAALIDKEFENSYAETKTEAEQIFLQSWTRQIGDIGKIVTLTLTAVFVTVLLIAGNTMAVSVRERIQQFGIMLALGFSHTWIFKLIVIEGLTVSCIGGLIGLSVAYVLVAQGDPTGILTGFIIKWEDIILGVVGMFILGLLASLLPSVRILTLKVADAVRMER